MAEFPVLLDKVPSDGGNSIQVILLVEANCALSAMGVPSQLRKVSPPIKLIIGVFRTRTWMFTVSLQPNGEV